MKTPLRIGCGNIYLNDSLFSFPSVRFYTTVYSAVAHPKGIEKGSFSPQLCILDIISQCIYIDGDSSSSEDPDEKGRWCLLKILFPLTGHSSRQMLHREFHHNQLGSNTLGLPTTRRELGKQPWANNMKNLKTSGSHHSGSKPTSTSAFCEKWRDNKARVELIRPALKLARFSFLLFPK